MEKLTVLKCQCQKERKKLMDKQKSHSLPSSLYANPSMIFPYMLPHWCLFHLRNILLQDFESPACLFSFFKLFDSLVVTLWLRFYWRGGKLLTTGKKRKVDKRITKLGSFQEEAIPQRICNCYCRKEHPTINKHRA